ncbi:UNVERIFIED_CONTAM: hypothetical protein GTU68_021821 [Idotea baltica]|nr:hypothetical protein [Idotea baltica]
MGLGPAHAIAKTLTHYKLSNKDIDYWEINEAFAAQVQACVLALNDAEYCKNEIGLSKAIGHPVGSSGARIVLHLANTLQREKAQKGIASLCIGGGQGGSMLVEAP